MGQGLLSFDHLTPEEREQFLMMIARWPDLLAYFEENYTEKQRAVSTGDEKSLRKIFLNEEIKIEQLLQQVTKSLSLKEE